MGVATEPDASASDADVHQVTEAIRKIRDPMTRYFVSMCVELVADRLADFPMDARQRPRLPHRMPRLREKVAAPAVEKAKLSAGA